MALTLHPMILAEGREAHLTIDGLTPGGLYRLVILPTREPATRLVQELQADEQGHLLWAQPVTWRGEALCDIYTSEGDVALATLHVYSAPSEILRRRPLRCDFHIHTVNSDGRNTPAEMVLRGRELGLDALAITDHNLYAPSLEGIEIAQRLNLGLLCYPGEEVSSQRWHLLSIGARAGLDWPRERTGYGELRHAIDLIHRLEGRAYLAHPYWITERHHHLPPADYERLLAEGGFDGIELLGDVDWEDNLRSIVRYCALDPAHRPPILGNSDTHRAEHTFGSYWTLVFATAPTHQSVLDAIADHYSVACMSAPLGPAAQPIQPHLQAFGPFELVDLAIFLDRYYFPLHDALCREQAELARRAWAGDVPPASATASAAADLEALYRQCWGVKAEAEVEESVPGWQ